MDINMDGKNFNFKMVWILLFQNAKLYISGLVPSDWIQSIMRFGIPDLCYKTGILIARYCF